MKGSTVWTFAGIALFFMIVGLVEVFTTSILFGLVFVIVGVVYASLAYELYENIQEQKRWKRYEQEWLHSYRSTVDSGSGNTSDT